MIDHLTTCVPEIIEETHRAVSEGASKRGIRKRGLCDGWNNMNISCWSGWGYVDFAVIIDCKPLKTFKPEQKGPSLQGHSAYQGDTIHVFFPYHLPLSCCLNLKSYVFYHSGHFLLSVQAASSVVLFASLIFCELLCLVKKCLACRIKNTA